MNVNGRWMLGHIYIYMLCAYVRRVCSREKGRPGLEPSECVGNLLGVRLDALYRKLWSSV